MEKTYQPTRMMGFHGISSWFRWIQPSNLGQVDRALDAGAEGQGSIQW